ncbi:MAG TPA: hypothetical protein VH373_13620 [Jatrophihabitantaceae bacterium]|jgi:hypothetical protein
MDVHRLSHASMPLLRMPETMPRPLVAVSAMLVLAGLDVLGAVLAKRWADGGSLVVFVGGLSVFGVLFWIYGSSLRYAELVPVTFGWIAALQIGLMLIERTRAATGVPVGHWVAAGVIIGLEGYLLAGH